MLKLTAATLTSTNVYMDCVSSISTKAQNQSLIQKLTQASQPVLNEWGKFDTCVGQYNFTPLVFCDYGGSDQVIISNVTKQEFMNLYTEYMVKGNQVSRGIYDAIKASAPNRRCPFCGIGFVDTLDHYLPKARYPVFSVNPKNLIPSCSTCNKGKQSSVIDNVDSQPLYPYNSPSAFYDEDWIEAVIDKTIPLSFEFRLSLPPHWSDVNKKRAESHFKGFNLAERYASDSAQFLTAINILISKDLMSYTPVAQISFNLLSYAQQDPPNTTFRIMLKAMSKEADICSGDYL